MAEPKEDMLSHDYAIGEMVPGTPYCVTEHLAAGGMGAVYEVEDTSIGRRFALKTLRAALSGHDEIEKRIREEAKILGRLAHPNIVRVFTAGVTDDQRALPFIAMERLSGTTLRGLIRRKGALSLRMSVNMILEILSGLEEAHDVGLIHRDIKPDNIFLHRERRGVHVTKLLDFGVAEWVTTAREVPNNFFGTLRYASPEQLRSLPISETSDLYSVGLLFYEMLAGHHVFSYAKTQQTLIKAQLHETPKMPDNWPPSVRTLIAAALAKDPNQRPKDAWTFTARLLRLAVELELARHPVTESEIDEGPIRCPTPSFTADQTAREPTLDVSQFDFLTRDAK